MKQLHANQLHRSLHHRYGRVVSSRCLLLSLSVALISVQPGCRTLENATSLPAANPTRHHIFYDGYYLATASTDGTWSQVDLDVESLALNTSSITSVDTGQVIEPVVESTELCGSAQAEALDGASISDLSWDPRPRLGRSIDMQPEHIDAVRQALIEGGLPDTTPIEIQNVTSVDLAGTGEGDLIEATVGEPGYGFANVGDYSVVLLQRDHEHDRIVRQRFTTGNEPDANKPDLSPKIFGDLSNSVTGPSQTYKIIDILDLNGDGVLDIVTEALFFESILFELTDPAIDLKDPVASLHCGP